MIHLTSSAKIELIVQASTPKTSTGLNEQQNTSLGSYKSSVLLDMHLDNLCGMIVEALCGSTHQTYWQPMYVLPVT